MRLQLKYLFLFSFLKIFEFFCAILKSDMNSLIHTHTISLVSLTTPYKSSISVVTERYTDPIKAESDHCSFQTACMYIIYPNTLHWTKRFVEKP